MAPYAAQQAVHARTLWAQSPCVPAAIHRRGRQEGELALELPPDVVEVDVDEGEPLEPDESLDPDEVDVEDDEVERESVR